MANQPSSFYRVSVSSPADKIASVVVWCFQEYKKIQRGFENVEKRLQAIESKLGSKTS